MRRVEPDSYRLSNRPKNKSPFDESEPRRARISMRLARREGRLFDRLDIGVAVAVEDGA